MLLFSTSERIWAVNMCEDRFILDSGRLLRYSKVIQRLYFRAQSALDSCKDKSDKGKLEKLAKIIKRLLKFTLTDIYLAWKNHLEQCLYKSEEGRYIRVLMLIELFLQVFYRAMIFINYYNCWEVSCCLLLIG